MASLFNNNSRQVVQQDTQKQYNTRGNSNSQGNSAGNQPTNNQSVNIFQTQSQGQASNAFQSNNQNTSNNNLFKNNSTGNTNNLQGTPNLFQNRSQPTNNLFTSQTQGAQLNKPVYLGQTTQNSQNIQSQQMNYRNQQDLINTLTNTANLQSDPGLHRLMIILDLSLNRCQLMSQRVLKETEVVKKENLDKAAKMGIVIKERCLSLKEKNKQILVEMLNLKRKIGHIMFDQHVRNLRGETEMDRLISKIKEFSVNTRKKMDQFSLQKHFNRQTTGKETNKKVKSITKPMNELSKATEILNRETMKLKEDFYFLKVTMEEQNM